MRLVRTAMALAALTMPRSGFAQSAGEAYRLPAPPQGFQPLIASDHDLALYGLPPRPSPLAAHGRAYAEWARMMAAARHYIAPELRAIPAIHGPAQSLATTARTALGTTHGIAATSTNWSGQTLQNSSTGYNANSYAEIMAQWVVSAVQPPLGTCAGTDYSALWVGIDGDGGSPDVLQAGTEADAQCTGGRTYLTNYTWTEWYPGSTYEVTNFPTGPGSSIYVVVRSTSATVGNATFVNLQTNYYTAVGISAPAGTSLRGNSAEWVVERPSPNKNAPPGTLADFGMAQMGSEIAYLYDQLNTATFELPGAPTAGQTPYTLTMVNSAGAALANSIPESTSAQILQVTATEQ